jgi:hypothetical protein
LHQLPFLTHAVRIRISYLFWESVIGRQPENHPLI